MSNCTRITTWRGGGGCLAGSVKQEANTNGWNGLGNDTKQDRLSTEPAKQQQTTATASEPSEPLPHRDDFESLAYVLIYLLSGSLPWYGAKTSTQKQCNKITQMKHDEFPDLLARWPSKFRVFLNYTRVLHFEDKPNYNYLCRLFHDLCMRKGFQYDSIFNWCLPGTSLDHHGHQTLGSNTRTNWTASKDTDTGASCKRVYVSLHPSIYTSLIMILTGCTLILIISRNRVPQSCDGCPLSSLILTMVRISCMQSVPA